MHLRMHEAAEIGEPFARLGPSGFNQKVNAACVQRLLKTLTSFHRFRIPMCALQ